MSVALLALRKAKGHGRMFRRIADIRRHDKTSTAPITMPNTWNATAAFYHLTAIDAGSSIAQAENELNTNPGYRSGNKVFMKKIHVKLLLQNISVAEATTTAIVRLVVVRFKKQNEQTETNLSGIFTSQDRALSFRNRGEERQHAWEWVKDTTYTLNSQGASTDNSQFRYVEFVIPVNKTVTWYDVAGGNTETNHYYMQMCAHGTVRIAESRIACHFLDIN